VCKDIPDCHRSNLKEETKWSDIVAGRRSHILETNPAAPQPIRTEITTRPHQQSLDSTLINNRFDQSTSITNTELQYEYDKEMPRGSTKYVELNSLQQDLSELVHILHVAERPSVKEAILADILLLLVHHMVESGGVEA
jgi:hypothetical protein